MRHPFEELRSEYESLLARCVVTRKDAVENVVRNRLLPAMPRYVRAVAGTAIPPAEIAGLHNRESDANFSTYLGNGEPLTRITRLVPKGRGPWVPPHEGAWERGAADAIRYDRLDDNSAPWSMAYALWKAEAWNGFGPRAHGRHSGYLWAGTNIYSGGKYVADGVWDAGAFDQQLGVVPLLLKIAEIAPQFAITGMPSILAPSIVPAPVAVPEGLAPGSTKWLQSALNKFGAHLVVDGNYGRRTREAVRSWQIVHNVKPVDGLAGPITFKAMDAALAAK